MGRIVTGPVAFVSFFILLRILLLVGHFARWVNFHLPPLAHGLTGPSHGDG